MRGVAVSIILAIVAGTALAEPRRTTEAVTLRKKPGEMSAAVGTLPAGTEVVIVAEEGRWLRVRANKLEGYLTRTTVTAPEAPAVATPGGWSTRAIGDDRAPSVTAVGGDVRQIDVPRPSIRGAPRPLVVRGDLGIGFRSLGMDLTANADGGLTNYVLDADAVAATFAVDATARLGARAFIAVDGLLQLSQSSPGISYAGPTSPSGQIPFKTIASDLGARAGLHAGAIFDLSLRAGFHYDAFLTDEVENAGMLPRERLLGATLGGRVDIAPRDSRFDVIVKLDVLVIGARAQTPGLEDGASSTARALWGGVKLRALLTDRWSLFGGYELGRATTRWSGASQREPGVTSATRVDSSQLVHLGVSVGL